MAHKASCEKYKLLTEEYIDGSLSEKERKEFEAHIEECPECRRDLELAIAIGSLIRGSESDVPEDLHSRIMSSVKAEPKRPKRRFMRGIAVSAACMLVFACCTVVLATLPLWQKSYESAPTEAISQAGNNSYTHDEENASACESDAVEDVTDDQAPSASPVKPDATQASPSTDTAVQEDDPWLEPEVIQTEPLFNEEATQGSDKPSTDPAPPQLISPNYTGTAAAVESQDSNRPGGDEITMALLIVSGLLAFASFIAFLISLSSVRKITPKKKDGDDNE